MRLSLTIGFYRVKEFNQFDDNQKLSLHNIDYRILFSILTLYLVPSKVMRVLHVY